MLRRTFLTAVALGAMLTGAAADPAVKGKLSIWLGYPETVDAFRLAQTEFRKKYPNVDVEILTFELREFEAKLAASVPAGSGPDLLVLHDFVFPRYFEGGSLAPMPDDLAKTVNDPQIIDEPFRAIVTRDGKPWGLPWWSGRSALFYNIDHFKEAGLEGPPKTTQEFWEYAQKLTKKAPSGELTRAGNSIRLTGASGGTQKFGYLYYQATGEQILEPGPKPGSVRITLKKHLDTAARVLLDHIEHLHGPTKVDDWALKHDAQGFVAGAASMFLREAWVIPFVKKNAPQLNFGVAPMPRDKAWGAFNFIEILSVNNDSKLKAPAWDFVRLLQAQPILDNVLEVSGWIPLRKDRDFSRFLAVEPRYEALINGLPGYTQYLEAPNVAYEEVTTRIGEIIQAAYRDASLVKNPEGVKRVLIRAHDTAARILKDQGILAE
jgi:multiple sugar transport system substrate-binding protein